MKRVIVELRVPAGLTADRILEATATALPGFTVDRSYSPVPSPPSEDLAASLSESGEEAVLVRGELEETQEQALRAEPRVIAVWSDARIEAFGKNSPAFG